MRVTQSIMFRDGVAGMQKQFRSLQSAQVESLSGNRINKPSDDPSATFRHIIFNTELGSVKTLVNTTGLAVKRLDIGEAKISQIHEGMLKARDTILQVGNSHMQDRSTMTAIGEEMLSSFQDTLINVNSTLDGVALFGASRSTSPYDIEQPSTTSVKLRSGGSGGLTSSDFTLSALDPNDANYPASGVPTSVRLTYDSGTGQYAVKVDDTDDPSSPLAAVAGVLDLGWIQITEGTAPANGDQYFFEVVPSYQGGVADRAIKTYEGQVAQGNITGKELMEGENSRDINIFGVYSGLRGALLRGDSAELSSWLQMANDGVNQTSEWVSVTGIRAVQVESAQATLQLDQSSIEETASLNQQADMFDVLSRMEQASQAIQMMTMSERTVLNTSLVDLLR